MYVIFLNQKTKHMPNSNTHTLHLTFRLPIYTRQIPQWRAAFVELAGWEADILHNHQSSTDADAVIYRYPLVQYRVRNGLASIFALNEGIEAVQQVLFSKKWEINWRGKPTGLIIENQPERQQYTLEFGTLQRMQMYKYLPFNSENYEKWQACNGLAERVLLLERILRGHILSCLWGLGWTGGEELKVTIQEIRKTQLLPYHGQRLMAFDLLFDTNVKLPEGIALGKAVSFGFGWAVPYTQSARRQHDVQVVNMPKQAGETP